MAFDFETKSWVYSKIRTMVSKDQFLGTFYSEALLSDIKRELFLAENFETLKARLESLGIDKGFRLTRKKSGKLQFIYPAWSTQIESLLLCWDEIVNYENSHGEDLEKVLKAQEQFIFDEDEENDWEILDTGRTIYGVSPNVQVKVPSRDLINLKDSQRNLLFPLTLDFKYEYNSFRKKVIKDAEKLLKKDSVAKILFVQTDIRSFYHSLNLHRVIEHFEKNHPKLKNVTYILKKILNEGIEELPIGWILSRFVAGIIVRDIHKRTMANLGRNILTALSKKQTAPGGRPLNDDQIKKITLGSFVSYVDDLVILLSIPNDIDNYQAEQIAMTSVAVLTEITNNAILGCGIRIHDTPPKLKYFQIDQDRLPTLKTNFTFIKTGDNYFDTEVDLKVRISDLMLPIDNDLFLNDVSHFKDQLSKMKELIITEDVKDSKHVKELLSMIKIKVEGEGAKYIRSVCAVLSLILENPNFGEVHKFIKDRVLSDLVKVFSRKDKSLPEILKFVQGYYRVVEASKFEKFPEFYDFLGKVLSNHCESRSDKDYIRLCMAHFYLRALKAGMKQRAKKPNGTFQSVFLEKAFLINHSETKLFSRNIPTKHVLPEAVISFLDFVKSRSVDVNPGMISSLIRLIKQCKEAERRLFLEKMFCYKILPFMVDDSYRSTILNISKNCGGSPFDLAKFFADSSERLAGFFDKSEIDRIEAASVLVESFFLEVEHFLLAPIFGALIRAEDEFEFIDLISNLHLPLDGESLTSWYAGRPYLKSGLISFNLVNAVLERSSRTTGPHGGFELSPDVLRELVDKARDEFLNLSNGYKKQVGHVSKTFISIDLIYQELRLHEPQEFKVTLCPISYSDNDLDPERGFTYKMDAAKRVEQKIEAGFIEAKKRGASIIVFPELTIPRRFLRKFLRMAGEYDLVLIAGLEYSQNIKRQSENSTVISFPIKKKLHPTGNNFLAFLQNKNFPAAIENIFLLATGRTYLPGNSLFRFASKKWGDFVVLTCSDYLSLTLRWFVQGEVQSVFVPAQNVDHNGYQHISETCIRDLHSIALVCNNPSKGGSFCYAPFYDKRDRTLFSIEGSSSPEIHTFSLNPEEFRKVQENAEPLHPFRKPKDLQDQAWSSLKCTLDFIGYKQLPPDWKAWK